jgi:hypothetical protein
MQLSDFAFTLEKIIETGYNYHPCKSNFYSPPKANKIEVILHIPSLSFHIDSEALCAGSNFNQIIVSNIIIILVL